MRRNTTLLIFFLVFLALLLGYNYFVQPFSELVADNEAASTIQQVVTNTAAEKLSLADLSDEEKIWQLIAVPLDLTQTDEASLSAELADITSRGPGLVTLFGTAVPRVVASDALETIQALAETKSSNDALVPLIAVDHEGGSVQRLSGEGFTRVPSWRSLCQGERPALESVIASSAAELRDVGVDVVFGPVVDVSSTSAVLATRTCAGDPNQVIAAANVAASLYQRQGMLPVLKHFPGIGSTRRDLHTSFDQIEVTPTDAVVYQELLDLHPSIGVMTSHVGVINQYPDIPCSLSPSCVNELALAYPQTLVFTDALEMESAFHVPASSSGSAQAKPTLAEVSVAAVLANNNVLVFGQQVSLTELDAVVAALLSEYRRDGEFADKVDASVTQLLTVKQQLR